MKLKISPLIALCVVVLIAVLGIRLYLKSSAPPPLAPTMSLEKMGQLVSLKMNYAEIIEFDQNKTLSFLGIKSVKYGGTKVLLVAKGDCTIGTDLTVAKVERSPLHSNDPAPLREVKVTLQQPRPLQVRINHDAKEKGGSYLYAVDNMRIEAIIPDQGGRITAINRAMTVAQEDVQRVCSRATLIDSARQNAETVLGALFAATGERATFVWR